MAYPRTPLAKAKVTGADIAHPERFKDRKEPSVCALGVPSIFLNETQKTAWEAFRIEIPWLTEADRPLVEMASILRAKMWTDPTPVVSSLTALRQCLSMMGASPTDRSKVAEPPDDNSDPLARFS